MPFSHGPVFCSEWGEHRAGTSCSQEGDWETAVQDGSLPRERQMMALHIFCFYNE